MGLLLRTRGRLGGGSAGRRDTLAIRGDSMLAAVVAYAHTHTIFLARANTALASFMFVLSKLTANTFLLDTERVEE